MSDEPKKICHTPTPGRRGTTRIPQWKYNSVRTAILKVFDESQKGQIYFKDLANLVEQNLDDADRENLGSLGWHVTTVKLNMEVEKEIERVAGATPQLLQRRK